MGTKREFEEKLNDSKIIARHGIIMPDKETSSIPEAAFEMHCD